MRSLTAIAIALCLLLPLVAFLPGCGKKPGAAGDGEGGPQGQAFKGKVTTVEGGGKSGVGSAAGTGGQAPFAGKSKGQ